MRSISFFKVFTSLMLTSIVALGASYLYLNQKTKTYTSKTNHDHVSWNGPYTITSPYVSEDVTSENIKNRLSSEFSAAFPNSNDYDIIDIDTVAHTATAKAKSYSNLYSGETNIRWNLENKINLPFANVTLSSFYAGGEIYANENIAITQDKIFSRLLNEYSNNININQILLVPIDRVNGTYRVEPKAESTIYNNASTMAVQINVEANISLDYTRVSLEPSNTNTGDPVVKYRGAVISNTDSKLAWTIKDGASTSVSAPLTFSNGKLTFNVGTNPNYVTTWVGKMIEITATYTAPDNSTYKATKNIFCRPFSLNLVTHICQSDLTDKNLTWRTYSIENKYSIFYQLNGTPWGYRTDGSDSYGGINMGSYLEFVYADTTQIGNWLAKATKCSFKFYCAARDVSNNPPYTVAIKVLVAF